MDHADQGIRMFVSTPWQKVEIPKRENLSFKKLGQQSTTNYELKKNIYWQKIGILNVFLYKSLLYHHFLLKQAQEYLISENFSCLSITVHDGQTYRQRSHFLNYSILALVYGTKKKHFYNVKMFLHKHEVYDLTYFC